MTKNKNKDLEESLTQCIAAKIGCDERYNNLFDFSDDCFAKDRYKWNVYKLKQRKGPVKERYFLIAPLNMTPGEMEKLDKQKLIVEFWFQNF